MLDLSPSKVSQRGAVVDRKRLLICLERAYAVTPRRSCKPILAAVRLECTGGLFTVCATDGEIALRTHTQAEGSLKPCVVPADDLLRRVRAARDAHCTLALRPKASRLTLTTGQVAHALATLPVEDFPPIPERHQGAKIHVEARELRRQLAAVSRAMATEPSRYAMRGTLLECDPQGTRIAATDGRRLAIADLLRPSAEFQGQVILPDRLVAVITKLADADSEELLLVRIDRPRRTPIPLSRARSTWRPKTGCCRRRPWKAASRATSP